MKFTITLDETEANLVMEALAALPFGRVFTLISRIHAEAQAQAAGTTDTVEGEAS